MDDFVSHLWSAAIPAMVVLIKEIELRRDVEVQSFCRLTFSQRFASLRDGIFKSRMAAGASTPQLDHLNGVILSAGQIYKSVIHHELMRMVHPSHRQHVSFEAHWA